MLDRIRQLLSKPKLSNEVSDFVTKLAASDIWILAVGLRGAPAIPDITDPTAFDIISAHRIDVSEIGNDDSVFPFNYERNGRQTLPFFGSDERAKMFSANSGFSTDVTVFQPCKLMAGFVAAPENELFELVFNPHTSDERLLTRDERLLLRSLCGGPKRAIS